MQETADKDYSAPRVLLAGPDMIHLSLDLEVSDELRATLEVEKAVAQEADKINAVHCPDWLGAQVHPHGARVVSSTTGDSSSYQFCLDTCRKMLVNTMSYLFHIRY
jgi:hypothetical protein